MSIELSSSAFDRADRQVAWLVAVSGLLPLAGQAVPEVLVQAGSAALWWNAGGLIAIAAILLLAAAGLWLPLRLLRILWVAVPVLVVSLQLAWRRTCGSSTSPHTCAH